MKKALIGYFSRTGKTEKMAEYLAEGVRFSGNEVEIKKISEIKTEKDLQGFDGYLCQKVAERYPEGILTLRGSYLWNHEAEIRNILDNAVARFSSRNPLERIIRMQRTDDALVIETTDNKLAEQLGRSLQKAHSGELQIDWQGTPVVCRVQWER